MRYASCVLVLLFCCVCLAEAQKKDSGTFHVSDPRKALLADTACDLEGRAAAPDEPLSLWYRQPARNWLEALPIGNGRLGAMVYGGVNREWLQLNEDTVWAGGPRDNNTVGGAEALARARTLMFENKPAEAEKLLGTQFLAERLPTSIHIYQMLGNID
jgi:alpha-L-fucosidase 2